MLREKANLYFSGLALMAIGLPVSEFLMSISVMILGIAWLVNGPKKMQWQSFKENKLAWSGVLLFLIPLVSMLWTSNYAYSLHDLRIKLPLLLVPFFVAPYSITKKQFYILLALLIGSTFVGTLIIFANYYINLRGKLLNIRDISIFISHIRFSLIINICIFLLLYAAYMWRRIYALIALLLAGWFIYFIFFLGSGNGFIVLFGILLFCILFLIKKYSGKKLRYSLIFLMLIYASYVLYLTVISYRSHFVAKDLPYNHQELINDHNIHSIPDDYELENGFYIWRNISYIELNKEWKKLSSSDYLENDLKGQEIKGTLIRYLTSKGLPKDSAGIHQLSAQDIKNIQNGDYHYQQNEWNNLQLRIDQFFFQLMSYHYSRDPGNKPFLQRLFYWKGALSIIKENPVLGVGGDIQDEFNAYFESQVSELKIEYWRHSHNQYLTYYVVAGILGFLAFLWAVFYPLKIYWKNNLILSLIQLVMLVSFLTEDTLETQPGVTMYVLFLALSIALINGQKNSVEVDVFDH
jgi:hypothetical protein